MSNKGKRPPVILVSGLPRSGTSMMMKMLASGGIEIYTDNVRQADEDNPQGYYEVEKVKKLQEDAAWLHHVRGRAVKIVSSLLYYVPFSLPYKVVFMRRDMEEILLSQQKMLERSGQSADQEANNMLAQKFETHLQKIITWIDAQRHIDCLYVDYKKIVEDPVSYAQKIQEFLGQPLNIEAMVSAVNPSLYRNRV
jgi:LPS sulfotransferase NodH